VTVAGVATATWAAVEPYAWLFGALIPPLGVIAWRYLVCDVRRPRAGGTAGGAAAVLLGATLGLLALFYTLLWLFLVEVLLIAAVIGVLLARRDGQPIRPALLRCLARVGVVAVISLPLTLVQWGPYLWSLYRHPVDVGGSLTYLPQSAAMFPVFHYPIDFAGVLALVGLLWALLRVRENVVARGLLLVVGAGYLYYAVSLAGALMNLTLMPFKIELVLDETLGCAGAFGLVDLLVVAHRRLPPQRRGVLVGGAALAALGMVGELQQAPTNLHDVVAQAYDSYYPSGATPLGGHDPSHWGAWNQPLHDAIAALTGKPEHDLVVLTTYQDFLSFWPYWSFLPSKIQYSNYLGQYDLRRTTVETWARSRSSTELLAALSDPRWRTPDVFVFTRQPDGLHLQTTRSVFPSALDNLTYDIVFPATLFDTPDFTQTTTGPFTVYARHPARPLLPDK
jgi:galactan 5-O-arabinofuranosyltransferase